VKIAQLLLTIPTIIAKFIGAVIISLLAGGLAQLLLLPLVLLQQMITGILGLGLKALNNLALPLYLRCDWLDSFNCDSEYFARNSCVG